MGQPLWFWIDNEEKQIKQMQRNYPFSDSRKTLHGAQEQINDNLMGWTKEVFLDDKEYKNKLQ